MLRTALFAAAALALSLPAAAATTVKVNVAGLDGAATRAAIAHAAHDACVSELRYAGAFELHNSQPACIEAAVARAEATLDTSKTASNGQIRVVAGR